MALQTSGPIALFLEIRAEEITKTPGLSATDFGLREVSSAAGFTEPDLMSEFYGYSSVTPIVWTAAPVEISKNDISINIRQNANTYNTGNGTITSKGFYYGTSTNINSATKVQVNTANNTAEFTRNFTGLSGGTTYRFWAYAINDAGETVSPRRDITTLPAVSLTVTNSVSTQFYIDGYTASAIHNWSWGDLSGRHQYQHPYYGMTTTGSRGYDSYVIAANGWLNWYFTSSITKANNATTRQEFHNGAYIALSGEFYVGSSETNASWFSHSTTTTDNTTKSFSLNTYSPWGGPFTGTVPGNSSGANSGNYYSSHWSNAPTNGNPKIESYTYFTRVGGCNVT